MELTWAALGGGAGLEPGVVGGPRAVTWFDCAAGQGSQLARGGLSVDLA